MVSENSDMECLHDNHFELFVDNLEPSRLMSCSVREVQDTNGAYLTKERAASPRALARG